eukprot:359602-Chlamydomonas_euryale.AAC.10
MQTGAAHVRSGRRARGRNSTGTRQVPVSGSSGLLGGACTRLSLWQKVTMQDAKHQQVFQCSVVCQAERVTGPTEQLFVLGLASS